MTFLRFPSGLFLTTYTVVPQDDPAYPLLLYWRDGEGVRHELDVQRIDDGVVITDRAARAYRPMLLSCFVVSEVSL